MCWPNGTTKFIAWYDAVRYKAVCRRSRKYSSGRYAMITTDYEIISLDSSAEMQWRLLAIGFSNVASDRLYANFADHFKYVKAYSMSSQFFKGQLQDCLLDIGNCAPFTFACLILNHLWMRFGWSGVRRTYFSFRSLGTLCERACHSSGRGNHQRPYTQACYTGARAIRAAIGIYISGEAYIN